MAGHAISLVLFTLVGIFTAVAPTLADFNRTHIYNPRWPPHAKYHAAHTMSLGALLGAATLYFTWRRGSDPWTDLVAATLFGAIYWIGQLVAVVFPNTALIDPGFRVPSSYVLGLPINLLASLVTLAVVALAFALN